jgi:hypothetical protein
MSMIRRVMIESCSIRVIMKSRKSWFKTKSARQQVDMSEEESAVDEMVAPRELSRTGMIYGLTEDENRGKRQNGK